MVSLAQIEPRTPISTNGTVITAGGCYYLTGNLTNSIGTFGTSITINANNVTLDLNGFTIMNTTGAGTQASGIAATTGQNITIRNGCIQNFYRGINVSANNVLVENMLMSANYYREIYESSGNFCVRNNQVYGTGGTTGASQDVEGINVAGSFCEVENNIVTSTTSTVAGAGCGIYLSNGSDVWVVNNRIGSAALGIRMNAGSTCQYRDNITSDCTTTYQGGTDRGDNF